MTKSCFKSASKFLSVLALGFLISACATPPSDPEERAAYDETNDPLEPMNRAIFGFNETVDHLVLRPAGEAYNAMPQFAQDAVRNFLRNLKSPVILLNDLLQGNTKAASDTLGRFMFNTLAGAGGIIDVAGDAGIEYHPEDFGQTLAVWGVSEGPYLVLPLLGPSNLRDTTGLVVDSVADPVNHVARNADEDWVPFTRVAVEGIDFRARNLKTIDDLRDTSIDFYATVRSLYRQHRNNLINNGAAETVVPGSSDLNLDDELEDEDQEQKISLTD